MIKKYLIIIGISIVHITLTWFIGYLFTSSFEYNWLNVLVGYIVLFLLYGLFFVSSSIYSTIFKDSELQSVSDEEYEDFIELETFIKPMDEETFLEFLDLDRYGNKNPDKEAILNLLDLVVGRIGYEDKEKLIYKKLAELKD